MKILKILLFAFLSFPLLALAEPLTMHHQLTVKLNPEKNELSVKDIVTLPDNGQSVFMLQLNSQFHLKYKRRYLHPVRTEGGVSSYHLAVDATRQLTLHYKGTIESTVNCSWLEQACVLLNENGVFLDGNSTWYPRLEGALHRFSIEAVLPEKWVSLSQGGQTKKGWEEHKPQRDIYFMAGPFKVYESRPDLEKPKAMVYLRADDPKLAQQYLDATHQYLEQYSRMFGDYPYAKFATVESFWETGWGMPSFTLLGTRVMRLPFILHSSFPHEILHNWWGNGVYVDSREGNWSEGLTAYLADHYNKPTKAERVSYRRNALQKYQTFTAAGGDFPLREFRSRHDRTTQTVGYDKSLMLFHMLRNRLGNKAFFAGLRAFYQTHKFTFADFDDLQSAFESSANTSLDVFFRQWRDRIGAPKIRVSRTQIEKSGQVDGSLRVELTLQQSQSDEPFVVEVPLKVLHKNGNLNHQTLRLDKTEQKFQLELPSSAQSLLVDPDFDVLRQPDQAELPPALNVLFNRQKKVFVLPRKLSAEMKKAWEEFIGVFSYGLSIAGVQYDDEVISEGQIVVLLGSENALLSTLPEGAAGLFSVTENAYVINGVNYRYKRNSVALTLQNGGQQTILIAANTPASVKLLTRKLPHYGKYSYLTFNNVTGKNIAKGQWIVSESPMTICLEGCNE